MIIIQESGHNIFIFEHYLHHLRTFQVRTETILGNVLKSRVKYDVQNYFVVPAGLGARGHLQIFEEKYI